MVTNLIEIIEALGNTGSNAFLIPCIDGECTLWALDSYERPIIIGSWKLSLFEINVLKNSGLLGGGAAAVSTKGHEIDRVEHPMADRKGSSVTNGKSYSQTEDSCGKRPPLTGEKILRMLLAENEAPCRDLLGRLFQQASFQVDFAKDGQEAVALWEQGGYDLVLMDVHMPRFNGFEATGIIRRQEQATGRHTPIVAMTAHVGRDAEATCLSYGMDAFIPKPLDFDKAVQTIHETITNNLSSQEQIQGPTCTR